MHGSKYVTNQSMYEFQYVTNTNSLDMREKQIWKFEFRNSR